MKYVLFIVSFVFAFSLNAQKQYIHIEVSNTEPASGENITISITTSVQGELKLNFPKEFQQGYSQMNGMRQEWANGVSKTVYYRTLNGHFTEHGNYVIGPVSVKTKSKTVKSNKVKVSVKKSAKKAPTQKREYKDVKIIKTLYGETQLSKKKIYEGEALYIKAKVFSKMPFENLSGYVPYIVNGKFDKVEYNDKEPLELVQEIHDGETFYTLELDKKVVFPIKSGTYEIEPFEMNILGNRMYKVNSQMEEVKVVKLPSEDRPASFNGLVGDFNFQVSLSDNEAEQNEVITLQVSMEGIGNHQHAVSPELELPNGMELYADPVVKRNIEMSPKGYQGIVSYTYPLKILNEIKMEIPSVQLSFFNPNTRKYVSYASEPKFVNAHLESAEAVTGSNMENAASSIKKKRNKSNLVGNNPTGWYKSLGNTVWIALGLLLSGACILFWYIYRIKGNKETSPENNVPSLKEIKRLLKEMENVPVEREEDLILQEIQHCLDQICSYLLATNSSSLSRNEIFTRLNEKIDADDIEDIKDFFNTMDLYRFGRDSVQISTNEFKVEFSVKMSSLIYKTA